MTNFVRDCKIEVDERCGEVHWIYGSKPFRSRLESGILRSDFFYTFATPWNRGADLRHWRFSIRDDRFLKLIGGGQSLELEFFYGSKGIPRKLVFELEDSLTKEKEDAEQRSVRADEADGSHNSVESGQVPSEPAREQVDHIW